MFIIDLGVVFKG